MKINDQKLLISIKKILNRNHLKRVLIVYKKPINVFSVRRMNDIKKKGKVMPKQTLLRKTLKVERFEKW